MDKFWKEVGENFGKEIIKEIFFFFGWIDLEKNNESLALCCLS